MLEKVGTGTRSTFTFVYMTLQEFTAARYLEGLPTEDFAYWVQQHYPQPHYREMLLLTGGTQTAAALTIETLLDADVPNDPISTAAFLATETLAEIENPPDDLRRRVIEQLTQRLTSPVPMVAYEAGDKLRLFAPAAPLLIGPLAQELAMHPQKWTREVACGLGLLIGPEYTIEKAIADVYPLATDTYMRPGRGHKLIPK